MREELKKIDQPAALKSDLDFSALESCSDRSLSPTRDTRLYERIDVSPVVVEIERRDHVVSVLTVNETDVTGHPTGDGFLIEIPSREFGQRVEQLISQGCSFQQLYSEIRLLERTLDQRIDCTELNSHYQMLRQAREDIGITGYGFIRYNQPGSFEQMAQGVKCESMILVKQVVPGQLLTLQIESVTPFPGRQHSRATVSLGDNQLFTVGRRATTPSCCADLDQCVEMLCNTFLFTAPSSFIEYVESERNLILPNKQDYPGADMLPRELRKVFLPINPDSVIPTDARDLAFRYYTDWRAFGVKGDSPCEFVAFAINDEECVQIRLGFGEQRTLIIVPTPDQSKQNLFTPIEDQSVNQLVALILDAAMKNPFEIEFEDALYRTTNNETFDLESVRAASRAYALWKHDRDQQNPIVHRDFASIIDRGQIDKMSEIPLLRWGKEELKMRMDANGITHFWHLTKGMVTGTWAIREQESFEETKAIMDSVSPLVHAVSRASTFSRPLQFKKLDWMLRTFRD